MRVGTHLAIALLLSCLLSCSQKQPKSASPKRYESVAQVPAETRKNLEAFARQLESDLKMGNTQAVQAAFSISDMIELISEGIHISDRELEQFKAGMRSGSIGTVKHIAATWSTEQPKYKGVVLYQGAPAVRFRFVSEQSGITILDLVIKTNSQGKPRIVDFYNQGLGFGMVEQARQTAAPMIAETDKTFLQRFLGKADLTPADIRSFAELSRKFRANDFAGAVAQYKTLPTILQTNLTSTAIYLSALQRLRDNENYKNALKRAAATHQTVNFKFMLVDAYFLDKEYDKAIQCLDDFMQVVGKDAALLTLKSLLLNAQHELPPAHATLLEAFQLEPDCIYAHSKGLDVLLAFKDFARVRDSMIFLEQHAGYRFKGKLKGAIWQEFKQAPESQQWR